MGQERAGLVHEINKSRDAKQKEMAKVQACTQESRKSSRLQELTWRSNTERQNLSLGWGGPDYGIIESKQSKGPARRQASE